jgi:GNAT superfamily N-acetyltransferase
VSRLDWQLASPTNEDVAFLEERLYEFNQAATGIRDGRGLGVFVRDAAGRLVAAAAGHTWGGSCVLRQVWVDEPLRGRGIGRELLVRAEAEARRRGCRQILLTTHSFQAPGFYQKLGFRRVAELADHPAGHAELVLRKPLGAAGSTPR